jgi:hypothetical protein
MELRAYETRDPERLLGDIAQRVRLVEGTAHLALVADISTTQRVLRVETLATPAEIFDDEQPREELRRVIEGWPIPATRGCPTHTPVLVVVRRGLCVFGPNEGVWLQADRYANHLASVWSMDLMLVTEHGWCDFMTDWAGRSPALAALD